MKKYLILFLVISSLFSGYSSYSKNQKIISLLSSKAELVKENEELKGQLDNLKGQLDNLKGQLDNLKGQLDNMKFDRKC